MLYLAKQYIWEIKNKKHYHNFLHSIANNESNLLTPQALHQTRKGLLDTGYFQRIDKGKHRIIDNFLEIYLSSNESKSALTL